MFLTPSSAALLAVVFAQYIEARCSVENKDIVGAALTGDAPTTSEWSTLRCSLYKRFDSEFLSIFFKASSI